VVTPAKFERSVARYRATSVFLGSLALALLVATQWGVLRLYLTPHGDFAGELQYWLGQDGTAHRAHTSTGSVLLLAWLHGSADFTIWFSYTVIGLTCCGIWDRVGADLPHRRFFGLFGLFVFASGLTHMMSLIVLFRGWFFLEGYVKVLTALAGVAMAVTFPLAARSIVALLDYRARWRR